MNVHVKARKGPGRVNRVGGLACWGNSRSGSGLSLLFDRLTRWTAARPAWPMICRHFGAPCQPGAHQETGPRGPMTAQAWVRCAVRQQNSACLLVLQRSPGEASPTLLFPPSSTGRKTTGWFFFMLRRTTFALLTLAEGYARFPWRSSWASGRGMPLSSTTPWSSTRPQRPHPR